MQNFNHFVVTRFNIKNKFWRTDKNGRNVNDINWLQERYDLFMGYCLPSMINQSNKNFKWLVFFDENTPSVFKEKNQKIHNKLRQFEAIYVDDYSHFEERLPEEIKARMSKDFVITSRFDNDDCYHCDAIKTIQDNFEPKANTIIDLVNGLTLDISEVNRLSRKTKVISGPFVSYIESSANNPLKTVYNCEHYLWKKRADFITVDKGYFWLQVIHGRNVSNQMSIDLISDKSYLLGFSLPKMPNFSFKYYVFVFLLQLGVFEFIRTIKAFFK